MTDYKFEDAVEAPLVQDTTPPLDAPAYVCQVCGKELSYSGRGRKPKFCDEHKKSGGTKLAGRGAAPRNTALASQATEALVNMNSLAAFGVGIVGYTDTADAINDRQEAFREKVYAALLADPDLCRSILQSGAQAGRVSLIVAYAMLAVSVFPTARAEHIELRKERADRRALDDAE